VAVYVKNREKTKKQKKSQLCRELGWPALGKDRKLFTKITALPRACQDGSRQRPPLPRASLAGSRQRLFFKIKNKKSLPRACQHSSRQRRRQY